METTEGTLLGGRVRYAQPRDGYRTGIEPVLLAASVPARAGERVIEAGVGAGAALMCLAARVPGIDGVGVEVDPGMADLARVNIAANGFAGLSIITGDVIELSLPLADHVMANPPWHGRRSTASPVGRRRLAKQEGGEGIEAWVAALGRAVREGGSMTMIVPPGLEGRWAVACAAAGLRWTVRHGLLPKVGRAAKLVLLRAFRGGLDPKNGQLRPSPAGGRGLGEGAASRRNAVIVGPTTLTPALSGQRERENEGIDGLLLETVLHEEDGAFTPAIEAILRHGAALADYGGAKSRLPGP